MTEVLRYDTAEYAGNRLNDSIVMYGDQPIRVQACGGRKGAITVIGEYLKDGSAMQGFLQDIKLVPATLGFVNTSRGIGYLTRISMRRDWKQGLRQNNLRSCFGVEAHNLRDIDLHKVIMGYYPSFDSALEMAVCEGLPQAFSRTFAISVEKDFPVLIYRYFGVVGYVKDGKPYLHKDTQYLAQELESAWK